jgi:hypothetical protein
MKMKKYKTIFFALVMGTLGLLSLLQIIRNYGVHLFVDEINQAGHLLVVLVLTFIPTLLCYALAWMLATDHKNMPRELGNIKKFAIYNQFTVISIAWNNLTPFFKVGGEPLKYLLLLKYLSKKEALASTINYNIIHLASTAFCFFITSLFLVFFYHIPNEIRPYLLGFCLSLLFVVLFCFFVVRTQFLLVGLKRFRIMKIVIVSFKIVLRRLISFYQRNPLAFVFSFFFDMLARFIEGLTFFFGFYLIKHPISYISSTLLDVGRTFVDTLFFFIPYQIGSREKGVHFFMEKILELDSKGFLTAVFLYRLVEICWIIIGYIVWASTRISSIEAKV